MYNYKSSKRCAVCAQIMQLLCALLQLCCIARHFGSLVSVLYLHAAILRPELRLVGLTLGRPRKPIKTLIDNFTLTYNQSKHLF